MDLQVNEGKRMRGDFGKNPTSGTKAISSNTSLLGSTQVTMYGPQNLLLSRAANHHQLPKLEVHWAEQPKCNS